MANTIELEKLELDESERDNTYCENRSLLVGFQASQEYPNASDAQITCYMNVALADYMSYSLAFIYSMYPYPD